MTIDEAKASLQALCHTCKHFPTCVNDKSECFQAIEMAIKALDQQHCDDCISRQAVLDGLASIAKVKARSDAQKSLMGRVMFFMEQLPPVTPKEKTGWIPVSERLPEELEPVNITWINHNPESYYADIKDKLFTATGVYFNGQWYWWSTLCTDILAEYSHNYNDIIDDDIEITAWQPLPSPYKAESEDKE